jgi:hypothetical protein
LHDDDLGISKLLISDALKGVEGQRLQSIIESFDVDIAATVRGSAGKVVKHHKSFFGKDFQNLVSIQ